MQGYDSEHPDIDLLRLRNYTIGRDLTDEEVLGENGRSRIADLLAAMQPFVSSSLSLLVCERDGVDRRGHSKHPARSRKRVWCNCHFLFAGIRVRTWLTLLFSADHLPQLRRNA